MTILAAIDIGSISVRLMVAKHDHKKLVPLYRALEITRLGKGIGTTQRLDESCMKHTLSVLEGYEAIADQLCVEKLLAVGTSAIRDAKNGVDFTDDIAKNTKIDMRIISGKEEAVLTFGGAVHDLTIPDTIMLIDVGGGSTEIICGNQNQILFDTSIDAGAVRMTEKYLSKDPVAQDEYKRLQSGVEELIRSAKIDQYAKQCKYLVGVGGTITSIAAIAQKLEVYDSKKVHRYELKKQALDDVLATMLAMKISERRMMIGLQPERADIIIAGAVIVQQIMEVLGWDEITVSESDILHGIIYDYLGMIPGGPFSQGLHK